MQENEALTIETISIETLNESNQTTKYTTRVVPTMTAILEAVYPVGAIYISVMNADPSVVFGFGTWQQVEDRFLLAAGSTYEAGSTGGEAEHVLTIAEMPAHNHRLKTDINSPDYNVTWPEWFEYTDGWTQDAGETEAPATHTTSTGGGVAHNNMPPYLVVYVWQRIE